MKTHEIQQLASDGYFDKFPLNASIIETHISWVLLSGDFVFKIKKPVKLSFLDFSTLDLRRHYCMRELILNQTYSDIYLDVLPIRNINGKWHIGEGKENIIDYAVRMKRLESESKMDTMLDEGKLNKNHIKSLANILAQAHLKAEKVTSNFNLAKLRRLFNSFIENRPFVLRHFGEEAAIMIDKSIAWSNKFLEAHALRMKQRADEGFTRLLHGDLHCGNVFIANPPILFDCIEFDDKLREIDLLSEIGFLCMDIEAHNAPELSDYLIDLYSKQTGAIQSKEDLQILHYYKCFRASIRAKVLLISAQQHRGSAQFKEELPKAEKYLKLIKSYLPSKVSLENRSKEFDFKTDSDK